MHRQIKHSWLDFNSLAICKWPWMHNQLAPHWLIFLQGAWLPFGFFDLILQTLTKWSFFLIFLHVLTLAGRFGSLPACGRLLFPLYMLQHLFERGKRVFIFGYYSGLVSKTTLNETDEIITNCFARVCVCVFKYAKKWQKFFKGKPLKDSKRQDLKRLDWCLSFQIVVPIVGINRLCSATFEQLLC